MSYLSLLTVEEMYAADRAAVAAGVASLDLMEAAGKAVAREVERRWPSGPIAVLCGPGNNGGDGFVAARLLARRGRSVEVSLLGDRSRLTGDAKVNADRWDGRVATLRPDAVDGAAVVIDALFGAGLTRPVDSVPRETLVSAVKQEIPVLAVDVPSGVDGNTGVVLGFAAPAASTVTFFRRKPGHLLLPGRELCGRVKVADIGIPPSVLDEIDPQAAMNAPAAWHSVLPAPTTAGHKYQRGLALLNGGAEMTGAALLAASGALRIGAGLVAIASPPAAAGVYRGDAPGLIVRDVDNAADWAQQIADKRVTGILVGPGNGVTADTRSRVLEALALGTPAVLDADALTVFEDDPVVLFGALHERVVLTPHEGEYRRLFRHQGGKLEMARAAAAETGAVVLLKGGDTVIAEPGGRAAINANGPPDLATAGSGDVLAGFIVGLLAQGMPAFEAACAGTWLHGAAGERLGAGLIAEDLPEAICPVLRRLRSSGSLASPTLPIV